MANNVLILAKTLIQNDPENTLLDNVILDHYQDLIDENEFYQLPQIALFRWAKASKNIHPDKAKILLERMHKQFGSDALVLLEFLTIDPYDSNSCALALSGLENCPICKKVFDTGNAINFDFEHVIDQLKKENEELLRRNKLLNDNEEEKEKQILVLSMQLSNSQKQLMEALNLVNSANSEKNKLQNEHQNLQNSYQELLLFKQRLEVYLRSREVLIQPQTFLDVLNQGDEKSLETSKSFIPVHEFLYKSSLFEGILHGLQLLMNSILDDYVIVTASSSLNYSYNPSNVLKNDSSYWASMLNSKPNEWIQFDFKSNKVAINAYGFKVNNSPKSWKIEGSNDNKLFTIIHNKTLNEDFKVNPNTGIIYSDPKGEKLYTLDKVSDMFRYIRITQGDDGNWNFSNNPQQKHRISFFRIELFGYYQR